MTGFSHSATTSRMMRSEEHTSELQSPQNLVCRLLLEKKKALLADLRKPPSGRNRKRLTSSHQELHVVQPRRSACLKSFVPSASSVSVFFFLMKPGPPEFTPFPHPAPFPF